MSHDYSQFRFFAPSLPALGGVSVVFGSDRRLRLQGRLFTSELGKLDQLARRIHRIAVRAPGQKVTVEVNGITWVELDPVAVFVTWAMRVADEPPERRYPLEFVVDARIAWQKKTFTTVRAMAPEVVRLDDVSQRAAR